MSFWQLFYHIVWTTKERQPRLTPDVEPVIHGFLRSKAIGLGAMVFALNGVEDHVHMIVANPPKIAVARFIGQVKGVASTRFNKSGLADTPFFWQDEYGVFSFDGKRLPHYIRYVERQKQHHARNDIIPILERVSDGQVKLLREPSAVYAAEYDAWCKETASLKPD